MSAFRRLIETFGIPVTTGGTPGDLTLDALQLTLDGVTLTLN